MHATSRIRVLPPDQADGLRRLMELHRLDPRVSRPAAPREGVIARIGPMGVVRPVSAAEGGVGVGGAKA